MTATNRPSYTFVRGNSAVQGYLTEEIYASLQEIYLDAITGGETVGGATWPGEMWAQARALLREADGVAIASMNGRVLGFASVRRREVDGTRILHAMTAVVRSDSQGIGIGYHLGTRMFIDAVRSFHGRPFVMAGRFFNPLGAQAIRKLVSDGRYVYPQIGSDSRPTEQLVQSARTFARFIGSEGDLDLATGVLRRTGAAGPKVLIESGTSDIDTYFATHVDSDRGDQLLLAVQITPTLVVRRAGELAASLLRLAATRPGHTVRQRRIRRSERLGTVRAN